MKNVIPVTIVIVSALGVITFYTLEHWPRPSDVQVLGTPSLKPDVMAMGKDTTEPTLKHPAPIIAPEIQAQQPNKHSLINAYYADPRPAVKFEGWKMAYNCLTRPHPRFCGEGEGALQPGDMSQDKRHPALIAAAEAGVIGAYAALAFHEHPRVGILHATWADEAEWERLTAEAKAAGIAHTDPIAISTQFAPGGATTLPPAKALEQWAAYRAGNEWDMYQQRYDPRTDDTPFFKLYASKLSESERNAAIQAGISLAYNQRGIK